MEGDVPDIESLDCKTPFCNREIEIIHAIDHAGSALKPSSKSK
jgi:hypothetical protein